jgi:putative ABC transport system permease protein
MFAYYFTLALRSLKRNVVLTVLMVAAIGVGIGASMTTLTVFRAMSGDPIPGKSHQLFVPQIDNWGPDKGGDGSDGKADRLPDQLSYTDAVALMDAHPAKRQSAMYASASALIPANPALQPFQVHIRAAYTDFFPMFEVPFLYGAPWSSADDADRAPVTVITRELNDKLFAGANSVGQSVNLDGHDYRVLGVLNTWRPIPKFYDLNDEKFTKGADVYLPFTRAIDAQMEQWGSINCEKTPDDGWEGRLRSECIWVQFWTELPSATAVADYRRFLNNYAAEQQRAGRFHWPPNVALKDVTQWLTFKQVVSDEFRILVLVSFSFLFVCLLNAMGLMLAKTLGRARDIGVRRALGANRRDIYVQGLIEAGVIGLAGAGVGLVLTSLGLLGLRTLLSKSVADLTHLDLADIGIVIGLAVATTVLAGLYPTFRAARIQPAWQLKAQ